MEAERVRLEVVAYFGATFAWTWSCWLPMLPTYRAQGMDSPPWVFALLLLGAYGPTLMALLLCARWRGREGVVSLVRRFAIWRVGFRWYGVVLLVLMMPLFFSQTLGTKVAPAIGFVMAYVPTVLLDGSVRASFAYSVPWDQVALNLGLVLVCTAVLLALVARQVRRLDR